MKLTCTPRLAAAESGSLLAAAETLALHAPDQEIDAVLPKERLVLERKCRHAPMARGGMVLLVTGDDPLVAIGIGGYRRIHRGEIEACGSGRHGEMVAFVPALDAAVPQHAADGIGKGERTPFELGCGA